MAKKGVVIEFDFAALNGAELLFKTAKSYLKKLDNIKLDEPTEARHLAGADFADGLAKLFASVKTKKTAPKAARELSALFAEALTASVPSAVTTPFKNFVKALAEKDVKVIISTRADLETVAPAFASLVGSNVVLYQDVSSCYGASPWDTWRRACRFAEVSHISTLVLTGSGFGVKSALRAGMGSVAVVNEHVAYQDFGGADAVIDELSGKTAKKVLEVLRV